MSESAHHEEEEEDEEEGRGPHPSPLPRSSISSPTSTPLPQTPSPTSLLSPLSTAFTPPLDDEDPTARCRVRRTQLWVLT